MRYFSVVIILSYIWLVFWKYYFQNENYISSLSLALLFTVISASFLAQALCVRYYLVKLSNNIIIYILYSYIIIPVFLILFQYILLLKMGVINPYENLIIWVTEYILFFVFVNSLTKFVGEVLIPFSSSDAKLTWTKHFPPVEVKDMYRGFFSLLFILAMPYILSLLFN